MLNEPHCPPLSHPSVSRPKLPECPNLRPKCPNRAALYNTVELALGGANYAGTYYPWTGRCKVAYLTDGGLTTDEVEALHSILADLIAATGR